MRVLVFVVAVGLAGCMDNYSVDTLTPEELQALSKVTVYNDDSPRPYTVIGTVNGTSCHPSVLDSARNEPMATQGMKIKAAQAGADAVINAVCQSRLNSYVIWATNCRDQVVCAGTAVKFVP